jgi:hypothetical protein
LIRDVTAWLKPRELKSVPDRGGFNANRVGNYYELTRPENAYAFACRSSIMTSVNFAHSRWRAQPKINAGPSPPLILISSSSQSPVLIPRR